MTTGNSATEKPLLRIQFPDQGPDDFAILEKVNPIQMSSGEMVTDVDDCIFRGSLKFEPETLVTVSGGCPGENTFEVIF